MPVSVELVWQAYCARWCDILRRGAEPDGRICAVSATEVAIAVSASLNNSPRDTSHSHSGMIIGDGRGSGQVTGVKCCSAKFADEMEWCHPKAMARLAAERKRSRWRCLYPATCCPNAERLITFLRRQRLPILSDD